MRTLHARGSELERSFTFGVVRQLFEPALFAPSDAERDAGSPAPPASRARCSRTPGDGQDESTYARLHGLYWLCANLAAEQPLLVCVDDAQWADEPSLSFLGFLARRLEDLPVALVLGTRPRAEQESDVLRGVVTDPGTRVAAPARADGAAVGQWVRAAVDHARRRGLLRRLPRDHGRQPVPGPRAAARGARQAAARDRRRGRRGARARPGGDLHRRAAAPAPPARRRAGAGARGRAPRRGRHARARRRARRASTRHRRGGARGALPRRRAHPRRPTGSPSCTRSCSRRSTPTCPCAPAATATPAPPGCCTRAAPRRRRSRPTSR